MAVHLAGCCHSQLSFQTGLILSNLELVRNSQTRNLTWFHGRNQSNNCKLGSYIHKVQALNMHKEIQRKCEAELFELSESK